MSTNSENAPSENAPTGQTPKDTTKMDVAETQAALAAQPKRRRRLWLSLFYAIIIFGSGFVVGGGVTLVTVRNAFLYYVHHPEEFPAQATARMKSRLDLTDDQAAKVEAILRQRQAALQEIRREVQPRVLAEVDQVEAEISEILTPEQRREFRERFQHLRETWTPPAPE